MRVDKGLQGDLSVDRFKRVQVEVAGQCGQRCDSVLRHIVDHRGELAHRAQVRSNNRQQFEGTPHRVARAGTSRLGIVTELGCSPCRGSGVAVHDLVPNSAGKGHGTFECVLGLQPTNTHPRRRTDQHDQHPKDNEPHSSAGAFAGCGVRARRSHCAIQAERTGRSELCS